MVGRVIIWVLSGLLCLLLLLLLLPATLYVSYEEEQLVVKVRLLFFKKRLYPTKPKPAKSKPKKREKETPKPEKPARSWEQRLLFVKKIVQGTKRGMRVLLRCMWVRDVRFVYVVQAAEPAAVATACGCAHALVGGTRAVLENGLNIQFTQLEIVPDFAGESVERVGFSCKIVACPVIMVAAGLLGLKTFWKYRPVRYTSFR